MGPVCMGRECEQLACAPRLMVGGDGVKIAALRALDAERRYPLLLKYGKGDINPLVYADPKTVQSNAHNTQGGCILKELVSPWARGIKS